MGGGKLPMFEEEKVSSDGKDIILDAIITAVEHNPMYYLAIASILLYSVLTFFFLQRDYVTIQSNPEVQWQLKRIRQEDKQMADETKVMYLDQKRSRRHKRRDFMAKYREQKLDNMTPGERTATLERIRELKYSQHFQERGMFIDHVKSLGGNSLTKVKIKKLKRLIRGDFQRYRDLNDDGYDSFEGKWVKGPCTKDEKMYYGSDSNSDLDSFGQIDDERVEEILKGNDENAEPQQKVMYRQFLFDDWKRKNQKGANKMAQQIGSSDEDSSVQYDEEYDDSQIYGSESDIISDNELIFDVENDPQVQQVLEEEMTFTAKTEDGPEEQKIGSEESSEIMNTSNSSSQKSKAIIEFDEEDQIVENKQKSKKNLQLEMVNLKNPREFVPEGKVNQSKKKREKRNKKKAQERENAILAEVRTKEKENAALRAKMRETKTVGKFTTAIGKVLKKKTVPKKKVVDDKGDEWEVVDERKTLIVEETDSDSDDQIAYA